MSDSNTSNSISGNVSGKAQDKKFTKVSGWTGVIMLGKEPTFDEVYGSGAAPMIVAHDKTVQKIPSPTRIAFESVLFGPSGDAKPTANRDHDIINPNGVDLSKVALACRQQTNKAIEQMASKIIGCGGNDGSAIVPEGIENATITTPPDAPANDDDTSRLIDSVVDFQTLVPVAHKIAVDKGWWNEGIDKRPTYEIIANYHAEVSEAWEEYRAGRMATWYAEGSAKPEGFWVEIADLLIRAADAAGAGRDSSNRPSSLDSKIFVGDFPRFIVSLHRCIAIDGRFRSLCEDFAKSKDVDLYAAVREKLRYNVTRPYRHGDKLA